MRKNRKNPIEVPMGNPTIDPSMAWSATPANGTPGAAPAWDPAANAGPYGDPYQAETVLYTEQTTYYADGAPYGEAAYTEGAPRAETVYADTASYPAAQPYADLGYGAAPPPSYPPLDDGAMDGADDDSGHHGPKVVVAIVAVLAAIILVVVGTNVYTVTSTRDDVHRVSAFYQQDTDAVVVLGASVYEDGTPSDILADRLEVAADLYKAGAAREVIVSGDNTDAHYNESDAMRDYLVELGVPADKIVVDPLGTDTYSSIYRAKHAFGANRIIVVTQAYHLYRALMVANGLGMSAGGVAADKGDYEGQTEYSIREVLARTKDCLMTLAQVPVSTAHGN